MINLMPPDLKEQIRFAKMNRVALGYARLTVLVVAIIGGIFAWSLYQVDQQTKQKEAEVSQKVAELSALKSQVLPKAQDASDRINAIKYVQSTQTHFSSLISDIAKVIPDGVVLDTLTLTGDDTKPVQVQVSSVTYDQALAFRNAIITSPRISAADIVSIRSAPHEGYGFEATVVLGFKPGQAK